MFEPLPPSSSQGRRKDQLFRAVKGGHERRVKELLDKLKRSEEFLNEGDSDGQTLLHLNAKAGKMVITRLLLDAGCRIDAQDSNGNTALHVAANMEKVNVARCLITAGANVGAQNVYSKTPLHKAVQKNVGVQLVEMLLAAGADVTARGKDGNTPLHIAVAQRHARLAELLIAAGADVHARDLAGDNLILRALKHKLKYNDYYDPEDKAEEPRCAAPKSNREMLAKLLLKHGADVNSVDSDGCPVLYFAINRFFSDDSCAEYRYSMARMLLEAGADFNKTMRFGRDLTVLEFAMQRTYLHEATAILEHAAKLVLRPDRQQQVLSAKNLRELDWHPSLKTYYEGCLEELRIMKTRLINGTTVSFYAVLTDDLDTAVRYAGNPDLVKVFRAGDYEASFPLYREQLKKKFYEARERQQLIARAGMALSNALQFAHLGHVDFEIILKYSNYKDMNVLANSI